jgi:hypothetical protein
VWEVMDSTGRTVKILIDPVPRAQLVRLPEWRPGQARIMRMPYDESFGGAVSLEATLLLRVCFHGAVTRSVTPGLSAIRLGSGSPCRGLACRPGSIRDAQGSSDRRSIEALRPKPGQYRSRLWSDPDPIPRGDLEFVDWPWESSQINFSGLDVFATKYCIHFVLNS